MSQNKDYIAHYGVLGMKWGVRRNPEKAYQKASKKFNRLAKRSDKKWAKTQKFNRKANRQPIGNTHRNAEIARRAYSSSRRNAKKATKWLKHMEKAFSKQSIVSIDPKIISKGNELTERYKKNPYRRLILESAAIGVAEAIRP